ncbi:MAG: hypothetical protein IJ546_00970 [Prevotella sp.]|nr:hypothetical protein [Prevotella sp.]MBR0275051.1 hypothetical protein [Prevotella sp.]
MATNESTNDALQQQMADAEQQRQQAEKMAQEAVNKTLQDTMNPANIAENMAKQEVHAAATQATNRVLSDVLPSEVNSLRVSGLRAIPVLGSIIQWFDTFQWFRSMFGGNKQK